MVGVRVVYDTFSLAESFTRSRIAGRKHEGYIFYDYRL